ncbi:MAG TPA: hypothetical protein VFP63_03195 [Dehalococcoidia bacterium]|nr:hypothetical protein [Dehalococcoidia bacterium]
MKVDFLILADGAQVAGDKLYVLGGGWTIVWARDFPVIHGAAVAVGMMVEWPETNHKHSVEVALVTGDGQSVGEPLVRGDFEVGRPPGMPPGAAQRFMLAAGMSLSLDKPGAYEIVVRIDGTDMATAAFQAVQIART